MPTIDVNKEEIQFGIGSCSMGNLLVAQSKEGICAILLGDDTKALAQDLQKRFADAQLYVADKSFQPVLSQVAFFVDNPHTHLSLPLDIRGTDFQRKVWDALRKITIGSTATYTEIATKIGNPKAFRAVAQACAANALAVIVPCHRVVRSDGGLSGYRWGIERKKLLLQKERPLLF